FTSASGSSKKLPMMRRTQPIPYFHTDGLTGIGIPYGKGSFSFYALMPDEQIPLKELVSHLDVGRWYDWMSRLQPGDEPVSVTLPRFKVTQEEVLNEPLSELGMGAAFKRRADYRPMGLSDCTL